MQIFGPKNSYNQSKGFTIVRSAPQYVPVNLKTVAIIGLVVLLSNLLTVALVKPGKASTAAPSAAETVTELEIPSLYLMDKASVYVEDMPAFEEKVKVVSTKLRIPPEWLMAVMYSESKFNAGAVNFRGSGAVGLIQWMPITAKELDVTVQQLANLDHIDQLDYVYAYLNQARDRYGDFHSLTDLYLAILYPKAMSEDYCYTLYAKPSITYKQNSGLDENKDGRVTVSDIDKRMQRIFPTAYMAELAVK